MNYWTSVDIGMPKLGVPVLVCVMYEIGGDHPLVGMETARLERIPVGSGCFSDQWVKDGGCPSLVHGKGVSVTHWMALPKYPS
jgi:hypothetical protein